MRDLIVDVTGKLLMLIGISFSEIIVKEEADLLRVDVVCTEPSRLIGWHGETLNAVQQLLKSLIRSLQKLDRSPFIVVDVDGYRLMQEDNVKKITETKADFVRRTGSRVTLSPMSPYFRRIVHMHIANAPALADLATESVGEGDERQVVIRLKEEKQMDSVSEELSPVMAADDGLENLDV